MIYTKNRGGQTNLFYDRKIEHSDIISHTEVLCYVLPHGSGIDSDWRIELLKNGNIHCHNAYHCMNQDGYYDGWIDFYVKLYRHRVNEYRVLQGLMSGKIQVVHRKGDIDFKIVGSFHLRWNKYIDVKDYLYDCIGYALRNIITHRNEVL